MRIDWEHLDYGYLLPSLASLPVPIAEKLVPLRAWLKVRRSPDSLRHALQNVARVFPSLSGHNQQAIARGHYRAPARDELEALWYTRPLSFFQRLAHLENLPVLAQAVERRKGVLLFSGHLGSTGVFFCTLGHSGFRINIVGRPIDPSEQALHPTVWEFNRRRVKGIEQAVGAPFILSGRGLYATMRDQLLNGESLIVLLDVIPGKRAVSVPFLGQVARLPYGIASLYKETGAALVFWTIHFDESLGRHTIRFEDFSESVKPDLSEQEIVGRLIQPVERQILQYPRDWWCWDSLGHFHQTSASDGSLEDSDTPSA